ncbi:SSI family serine proteinase inhibitor [Streptomyces sp. M19]
MRAAGGEFTRLRTVSGPGRVCTKDWRPVVVSAEGVWEGHRVRYEHTYPNECLKKGAGSRIFDF